MPLDSGTGNPVTRMPVSQPPPRRHRGTRYRSLPGARKATIARIEKLRAELPRRLAILRGDWSQNAFAAHVGVFQQRVNESETGGHVPHVDYFVLLALVEGVSLDWLLLDEGPMYRRQRRIGTRKSVLEED